MSTALTQSDLPEIAPYEGETSKQFQGRRAFMEMGGGRSLLSAYNLVRAQAGKEPVTSAPGSWRRWAERWQWEDAARAYDARIAEAALAGISRAYWRRALRSRARRRCYLTNCANAWSSLTRPPSQRARWRDYFARVFPGCFGRLDMTRANSFRFRSWIPPRAATWSCLPNGRWRKSRNKAENGTHSRRKPKLRRLLPTPGMKNSGLHRDADAPL